VASSLGVEMILNAYYETPGENRAAVLEQAFERANLLIHSEGRGTMGTTGVAALLFQDVLHIANVGDSRAYLIRNGTIHQISRDHSLVSDQVAAGLVTPEQARSVHYRNVITRALGYQQDVVVDLFRWPLQVNDLIVLSSDGLHGLIEDAEIAQILTSGPLANTVEQLVDLANERGGTDNITAVAIVVETLDWDGPDDDEDDHDADPNATTQPFPIPQISAPPSVQHSAPAPIAPPEAAPAAPVAQHPSVTPVLPAALPQPSDRRLTPLGGLLAAIVLIALVTLIFISMNANPAQPPPPLPAATAISAPTNLPLTPTTAAPIPIAPTTPTIAP
jgi:protein phosphatase